ncbi:MAG: RNA polymerase sigma factor RpoD/SigA [Treponema sp.]|jgi:RNA polymerase primary sigma factor|nr:RNA polymerase sigma factor RpoD/SigA [Treponema sp.]
MHATKERRAKKTVKTSSDDNFLAMYLREISRIPLLSKEEEEAIVLAAAKGNKAAHDKLINSNLRFVVNVAKKYQNRGLPLTDLIGEGNIGLIQALDHFDGSRGYRFISYAVWWIRQSILKALNEKARMIRLPQNRANELLQIERVQQMVREQPNEKSEIQEIADFLEMDKDLVGELLNISREMVSLEVPVYVDRDSSILGDFIEDKLHATPDQNALQGIMRDDIESVLDTLNKKEADIIRFRYGLGSRPAMSLKEIGDRFNLTKERIRQIEKKALLRLQHPSRVHRLAAYVA